MMWKMHSKIKDSNLGTERFNVNNKKKLEEDDLLELNQKRNRTTSSIGQLIKHNFANNFTNGKSPNVGQPFLGSLAFSSLAADSNNTEELSYEKRQRGMSGMDDNNFF